jgi:hypothetical protein
MGPPTSTSASAQAQRRPSRHGSILLDVIGSVDSVGAARRGAIGPFQVLGGVRIVCPTSLGVAIYMVSCVITGPADCEFHHHHHSQQVGAEPGGRCTALALAGVPASAIGMHQLLTVVAPELRQIRCVRCVCVCVLGKPAHHGAEQLRPPPLLLPLLLLLLHAASSTATSRTSSPSCAWMQPTACCWWTGCRWSPRDCFCGPHLATVMW